MSNERKDQMETPCGLAETLRGTPLGPHLETQPSGMQKDYVVLTAEERAKGFVEPVRRSYRHEKCGSITTMGVALAETYARCPDFYSGTFCVTCGNHFPVGATGEFTWEGTTQKVGTRRAPPPGAPAPASDNPSSDGATTTTPARGSEEAGALLDEAVTGLETEGRRLGKAAVAYFQSRKTYPSGEVAVGEVELRELRAAAVAFGEQWKAAKGEGSDGR